MSTAERPAIDAEVEHAERHDRIVAFALRAAKRVMEDRRRGRNFRRRGRRRSTRG
jgi:hypothetical protein